MNPQDSLLARLLQDTMAEKQSSIREQLSGNMGSSSSRRQNRQIVVFRLAATAEQEVARLINQTMKSAALQVD